MKLKKEFSYEIEPMFLLFIILGVLGIFFSYFLTQDPTVYEPYYLTYIKGIVFSSGIVLAIFVSLFSLHFLMKIFEIFDEQTFSYKLLKSSFFTLVFSSMMLVGTNFVSKTIEKNVEEKRPTIFDDSPYCPDCEHRMNFEDVLFYVGPRDSVKAFKGTVYFCYGRGCETRLVSENVIKIIEKEKFEMNENK